ncbi:helix-turn-helix domain-containing protein [Pararhizobium sp. BT-229]|uniref:helix-turn-helix domain-containing protein n=1 Tax=Pararhizobium sp. BT-229 TaxID=2986923 RepID=UPI0021F74CAC|nr:helix-turn-helix transcriptional regulator [Pararhizobium sp. BT-229]MCV9964079.1 helix-turn-helix domain-containing protein [Pararhizobium sp. BT-229]
MNETKKRGPRDIDVLVGHNLRTMRNLNGMSQTTLGDKLELTFQQIQKYEKGTNRIAASTLWELARIFGVSVEAFYQGADETTRQATSNPVPILSAQAFRLGVAYDNNKNPAFKKAVTGLLRSMDDKDTDAEAA